MNSKLVLIPAIAFLLSSGAVHAQGRAENHDAHQSRSGSQAGSGKPMMEHMKTMQAQMQRIREAKDPAERQKLMDEHMKSMHESMGMMRGMKAGGGGAKPEMRMQVMEQRMDMMQMMMDQMMQREAAKPPVTK